MNKSALRQNVETVVKLLPRPLLGGALIADQRNSWLIVEEVNDCEALVFQNTITRHEGTIAYDNIREFRKPNKIILRGQVTLGKEGRFEFEPFVDAPDTDLLAEQDVILPERLSHAEVVLNQCSFEERTVLRELLIREKMTNYEIEGFCNCNGLGDGRKFFSIVNGKTSLLERDGKGPDYHVWIKPGFVPVLSKLLLDSQKDKPAQ